MMERRKGVRKFFYLFIFFFSIIITDQVMININRKFV